MHLLALLLHGKNELLCSTYKVEKNDAEKSEVKWRNKNRLLTTIWMRRTDLKQTLHKDEAVRC